MILQANLNMQTHAPMHAIHNLVKKNGAVMVLSGLIPACFRRLVVRGAAFKELWTRRVVAPKIPAEPLILLHMQLHAPTHVTVILLLKTSAAVASSLIP